MAEGQNKHPNVDSIQPSKNVLKAHYSPGTAPDAGNDDDKIIIAVAITH